MNGFEQHSKSWQRFLQPVGLRRRAAATLKRHAAWDMLSDCGEMAERTKAPVSKTGISSGIVGSNPTLSARFEANLSCNVFTPVIEVADKFRRVNAKALTVDP